MTRHIRICKELFILVRQSPGLKDNGYILLWRLNMKTDRLSQDMLETISGLYKIGVA
jgi:hypothetical protein